MEIKPPKGYTPEEFETLVREFVDSLPEREEILADICYDAYTSAMCLRWQTAANAVRDGLVSRLETVKGREREYSSEYLSGLGKAICTLKEAK